MNALNIVLTINCCLMASGTTIRGAHSPSDTQRRLETVVQGDCTVTNFANAVGGTANLADRLGVQNDEAIIQQELDSKCDSALSPTIDLSDTLGKGPQFLKNFLDGGTTWNDNFETGDGSYSLTNDAAVISSVYNTSGKTTVFGTPDGGTSDYYDRYFSNFYAGEQECQLGVIECCYTSSRESATGNTSFEENAAMCALDLQGATKSNHIKARSFTYFDTQPSDETYCSGFAYEEDSFGDSVKYNSLFHMAMMTNLYEKGYVKNIPGAPLCGCVEQMPIIDNADCIRAVEGYKMDENGEVSVDISWEDCGMDLASYYETLDSRSELEKYFVKSKIVGAGNCEAASLSFMNDQMFVPSDVQ